MTKQKAAAPGKEPGTASKAQAKSTKACITIVHNNARKRKPLKTLLVAFGAAGWGWRAARRCRRCWGCAPGGRVRSRWAWRCWRWAHGRR